MDLTEQNARLRSANAALQEELREAHQQVTECKQHLGMTERRVRGAWRKEVEKVMQTLLPNLVLVRDSMDVITLELDSHQQVLQTLHTISTNPAQIRAEHVESTVGWKELHFSTGQKDDGRLYFKHDQNKWSALVSFKEFQRRDIGYLRKH